MRRVIVGSLALALAVGCRSMPATPVILQGSPVSIARLSGAWVGEYWGGAAGRGGSLSFALRAGTDSLFGEVTMVDWRGQQLRPADPMDVHRAHVEFSQHLRIDLVMVQGDSVRGVLEPYLSPDCDCTVSTTFFGAVKGDVITGRFETRNHGEVRAVGSWELKRAGDATR